MCEIFFFIAVSMCDLLNNIPSRSHISENDFQVLFVTEKCHVQSSYYTLGNAEQQLAKCHFKN